MQSSLFLAELDEYLRGLAMRPGETGPPTASWARDLLLRALQRVEHGESQANKPDVTEWLKFWRTEDRIVRFVWRLDALLRAGLARETTPEGRRHLIEIGLCRWFEIDDKLESTVRTLELEHLVDEAVHYAKGQAGIQMESVASYAAAIRAVTPKAGGVEITPIGRVFLDLVGKDAVRWLLHVEVTQSIGPQDPARLSREMAGDLCEKLYWWMNAKTKLQFSWPIVERLASMGLVSITGRDKSKARTVTVLPVGRELLAELEKPEGSPLALLASTLNEDLMASAVKAASGKETTASRGETATSMFAAEATARTARLVVHEIRNTLLPVRSSLDSLYREILVDSPVDALNKRRPLIDQGLTRIFEFIDQLNRTANLAGTSSELFDPGPAIRDAVSGVQTRAAARLDLKVPSSGLPSLQGNRGRFVMALVNLLRNAFQHGGEKLTAIRVHAEPTDNTRAILITVEDDGQGVPGDLREEIFTEGVSLSPNGTGLGLALVREVFEQEFRGIVVCDPSPLGGARFRIRVSTGASS